MTSDQKKDNKAKRKQTSTLALFSIVVLVHLLGCIPATAADQVSAVQDSAIGIVWGKCDSSTLVRAGAQCGFLSVPLDHSRPNGKKIQIAVSRIKHNVSADKFQGIMLTTPTSIGSSGIEQVTLSEALPGAVSGSYDWIGFDSRGSGSSRPALSCMPDIFVGPRPNYIPSTKALKNFWLNRSEKYATACAKNNSELLKHLTSIDRVKDMDRIRVALGHSIVNIYGVSYGTYLGQLYYTLYPNRVRRMVLDSNFDPRYIWFESNLQQDLDFQRTLELWFGWVAEYDSVYHLGQTQHEVAQRWNNTLNRLQSTPADSTIGPAEWLDIFTYVGFTQAAWPSLASAFASWVNEKNASQLVSAYTTTDTPGNDNSYAVYLGVICTDAPWPRNGKYIQRKNWQNFEKAPLTTWWNGWYNGPCQFWPVNASKLVNVDGSRAGGLLLIGETLDAVSPFAGSLEARRRFPHARLIGVSGGTTNGNSLKGNKCVDKRIARYLRLGQLPPRKSGDGSDILCPPLPRPVPTNK